MLTTMIIYCSRKTILNRATLTDKISRIFCLCSQDKQEIKKYIREILYCHLLLAFFKVVKKFLEI